MPTNKKIPYVEIINPSKPWSPCCGEGCEHPSHKGALTFQSEYYPQAWKGKIPKTVRLLKTVKSFPWVCNSIFSKVGNIYPVYVNSHGAVSIILMGQQLGLKPDEFEVIDWHSKKEGLDENIQSKS